MTSIEIDAVARTTITVLAATPYSFDFPMHGFGLVHERGEFGPRTACPDTGGRRRCSELPSPCGGRKRQYVNRPIRPPMPGIKRGLAIGAPARRHDAPECADHHPAA